ncbi:hypothetical protein F4778DRAFT_785921 [Xylariomycetidae sp. FL2044]|nr:hypothetical protein F4778DRAFT_785921 [Xylariomycetidae sp. FL2044]
MSQPPVLRIPNELLLQIQEYVVASDPRDLMALASTCRELNSKLGGPNLIRQDAELHRSHCCDCYALLTCHQWSRLYHVDGCQMSHRVIHWSYGGCPAPSILRVLRGPSSSIGRIEEVFEIWKSVWPRSMAGLAAYYGDTSPAHEAVRLGRLDALQALARQGFSFVKPYEQPPIRPGYRPGSGVEPQTSNLVEIAVWNRRQDIALWLLRKGVSFGPGTLLYASGCSAADVLRVILPRYMAEVSPPQPDPTMVLRRLLIDTIQDAQDALHEVIDIIVGAGASLDADNVLHHGLICRASNPSNAARVFGHVLRTSNNDTVLDPWVVPAVEAGNVEIVKMMHPAHTHLIPSVRPEGGEDTATTTAQRGRGILLDAAISSGFGWDRAERRRSPGQRQVLQYLLGTGCEVTRAALCTLLLHNIGADIDDLVTYGKFDVDAEVEGVLPMAYALDSLRTSCVVGLLRHGARLPPVVGLRTQSHWLQQSAREFSRREIERLRDSPLTV